jgi:hypothetical protein
MTAFVVRCPGCSAINEFFVLGVAGSELVTCSRCHGELGKWGSLLEEALALPSKPLSRRSDPAGGPFAEAGSRCLTKTPG